MANRSPEPATGRLLHVATALWVERVRATFEVGSDAGCPAGLETRDTSDLEVCATPNSEISERLHHPSVFHPCQSVAKLLALGTRRSYSYRNAFTGSRRAAKYAGISAAMEQITNALMQMIQTSRGTTSAGIAEN